MLLDPTVAPEHIENCNRFTDSLNMENICTVASSHNNNRPCKTFHKTIVGGYNICIPVIFKLNPDDEDYNGEKWMARIPFMPQTAFVEEKMRGEIGTMKYLAERTKIPIPQLRGYSLFANNPIGLPYIFMDYIEGQHLDISVFREKPEDDPNMNKCFDQLIQIYMELYKQQFDRIGSISLDDNGNWFFDSSRPLITRVIDMQLAGYEPNDIIPPGRTFTSAVDYFYTLIRIAFRCFEGDRLATEVTSITRGFVYMLYGFRDKVLSWIKADLNTGPFILMHGDLFGRNILVDDDYNIKAVIDWEFAHAMPAQLFLPPTWICGRPYEQSCDEEGAELLHALSRFRARANAYAREQGMLDDETSDHPLVSLWDRAIGSPVRLGDFIMGQAFYRLPDLIHYCIIFTDQHFHWRESSHIDDRLEVFYNGYSSSSNEWKNTGKASVYRMLRKKLEHIEKVEQECNELGIDMFSAFCVEIDENNHVVALKMQDSADDVAVASEERVVEETLAEKPAVETIEHPLADELLRKDSWTNPESLKYIVALPIVFTLAFTITAIFRRIYKQ